jgi:predicted  nucleic acid-binding Zn-ribbon protein
MYMFKDNLEAAQAAFIAFEQGIKDLQTLYINNEIKIRDTRIRY